MTDYTKRLDKFIEKAIRKGVKIGKLLEKKDIAIYSFKTKYEYQQLTQLFRDMVEEAKPELLRDTEDYSGGDWAYDRGIDLFESNLLKLLGEKE